MWLRGYEERDAPGISRLFFETVHAVNRADYSMGQLHAWAPRVPDPKTWHELMGSRLTLVAEAGEEVLGFAEMEEDGHLDMLYVHKTPWAGALDRGCTGRSNRRPGSEAWSASYRVKHHGPVVLRARRLLRSSRANGHGVGVAMTDFAMKKSLRPDETEAAGVV